MSKIIREQEYVPIGRAAQLLGVTTQTLRNWEKRGKLKPNLRVGTRKDRRYKIEIVKTIAS